MRCGSVTGSSTWSRTRATCGICRRISMCCAGLPAGRVRQHGRDRRRREVPRPGRCEPWAWMQPARHAYGALLLEQDRVAEAEAVYRAGLGLDATLARLASIPATCGACTATTNA